MQSTQDSFSTSDEDNPVEGGGRHMQDGQNVRWQGASMSARDTA